MKGGTATARSIKSVAAREKGKDRVVSPSLSRRAARGADRSKPPLGTQSIHRAVSVLRELSSPGKQGTRLVDLAAALRLERPTVHRILKGLMAQGMVSRDDATKSYRLGHLVYELGLAASPHYDLKEVCHPVLQRIAAKTQDSVFLSVRSGLDAVCIDRLEGSYPIQARMVEVGGRRPLGMGASGLALLLELNDDEVERVILANAPRLDSIGRIGPERLRTAIRTSRKAGYAINDEDVLPGVRAIGVAIHPRNGPAYAAITIAGISARFEDGRREELAALLMKEAKALGRRLEAQTSAWA